MDGTTSTGMVSHSRTASTTSTLSDLSQSISSDAIGVSVMSDDFKLKVEELIACDDLNIDHLERRACRLISDLEENEEYNIPLYGCSEFQREIKLHRILKAMLEFAYECGKDNGKRYAACAICACCVGDDGNDTDDDKVKLAYLQSLSTTWLSHLLFVFKANSSHCSQPNATPSTIATPTLNETAVHLDEGADVERPGRFKTKVVVRDGYRCVVTGRYDTQHPQVPEDQDDNRVDLQASHILWRAIAVFKGSERKSDEYVSALTTFDILQNYAAMPIKSIEDIAHVIDDPSNGLTLEANAHNGFDRFRWSLKETDVPNQYILAVHEKGHGLLPSTAGKTVTFTDHSRDFEEPSSPPRKRARSSVKDSDLPNPLFIRIHSAIAGVLHMSGAGECIDRALDRAGKSGKGVVLTGADFARLGLAEDLSMILKQVAVC